MDEGRRKEKDQEEEEEEEEEEELPEEERPGRGRISGHPYSRAERVKRSFLHAAAVLKRRALQSDLSPEEDVVRRKLD